MIPFRPNNSPQSWMYIAAQGDYQKLSAPTAANAVTAYGVGIAEPTSPPDAAPTSFNYRSYSALAASWTNGGTAGATADANRITADTATTAIVDPASNSLRWSVQVATTRSYQIGQLVNIVNSAGGSFDVVIQDVIPPLTSGATLTVQTIFYYSGTSGRCVIVPTQLPAGTDVPTFEGGVPTAASVYDKSALSSLRRGALVRLNATETVLVLSVTTGPDGTIAFECSTTGTIAAGQAITGLPCIVVSDINANAIGQAITSVQVNSALSGAGIGTLTQALGTNPFTQALAPSSNTPQEDDYVAFQILFSDISTLIQGTIIFDVNSAAADYTTEAYYYIFNVSNLILPFQLEPSFATQQNPNLLVNTGAKPTQITQTRPVPEGFDPLGPIETVTTDVSQPEETIDSNTPLPTSQWATVMIPIRSLKKLGSDLTRTLANCQGVRLSIETTAAVNVSISSFWIGGGGQPDVVRGTPYFYCFVGRNRETGARSNPSPITRYGVSPRRQRVYLTITDTINDAQVDVWDIYRFGGTVTSWRRIGTISRAGATTNFTDNYFDTSAIAGSPLERDNFEPWPSIATPYNAVAGTVAGVTTAITVTGHTVLVTYSAAAPFTNPAPATILRWLPGTLVTIGGQSTYTLWNRPTAVTLASPPATDYFAYLFQLVENAGTGSLSPLSIREPIVANQNLPYIWGPDANGTVFACGDPLRPGVVYPSKANNPDSAPDTYPQEICPPSEPLLGGEVLNGLSFVASSNRWWALYSNFGSGTKRYQAVEKPVGRGLAAPYGHTTDGSRIFFWAEDGIWMHSGGVGDSLTDEDLFNLFPHEGVNTPENYTYGTYTIYAPDYRYAGDFRLSFINGYLYADYRDSGGNARTLVCDLRDPSNPAWAPDVYRSDITATCHYAVEQQAGTVLTEGSRYHSLLMGDGLGRVYRQTPNTNDGTLPIDGVIATFEYNGGDIRQDQLFNDVFLDFRPVAGINVSALANGAVTVAANLFAASAARTQTSKTIGQELKYLGILLSWADDFTVQSVPTQVFAWQPMYQGVPVSIIQWRTQVTSFGLLAYKHLRQWNFAYRSTADVNITVTVYDGTAPAVITLPSTGGNVRKIIFPFTFNKGMLYQFTGVTADGSEWTPYLSDSELCVGEWGRTGPYLIVRDIEGPVGIRS